MENVVKVKCSFCGKEIECPENMLKDSKKHMCFECFSNPSPELERLSEEEVSNIHIDIPRDKLDEVMPDFITNNLMSKVFPGIWDERKDELKELSKKELAKVMFADGIRSALGFVKEMDDHYEDDETEAG